MCFIYGATHSVSNTFQNVKSTWHQAVHALMINYNSNRKDKQPNAMAEQ